MTATATAIACLPVPTRLHAAARHGRLAGGTCVATLAWLIAVVVRADTVGGAPATVSAYSAVVAADRPLGHWPLSGSLEPDGAAPAIEAGGGPSRFRPGPIAGGRGIDLGRGGWLQVPASPALDVDALTVEMIFQIKYPHGGALFGMRDGAATRFSLHCDDDSPILRLWNGSRVIEFEAARPVVLNGWHHVALAISSTESTVWLDGVRCRASGGGGLSADARGLPLLVGCSDAAGKAERAEILVAHLAIHPRLLPDDRLTARMQALGWADRLGPRPRTDPAADIARIADRVDRLATSHGVRIQYQDTEEFVPAPWRSGSDAAPLPVEQVPRVLDEIEAFLAVVPAAVTNRDLDTIYVMNHLKMGDSQVGALAYEKSIYLPCGRPTFDIRCSLYHELSHILQVAHPIDEEAWKRLLPEGFTYIGSDKGMNPFAFDDEIRKDGFILRYSMTNRHEDIAVLSDWLFVRRQQALDLCDAHPAIRRKIAAIVAWYRAIDPGYDLSFYDDAIRGVDAPTVSAPPKPADAVAAPR